MKIDHLDHLVLTVKDVNASVTFYEKVLGFTTVTFRENRKALTFGQQKINLHQKGHEFEPKAAYPTPGATDLCFITTTPLADVIKELRDLKVKVEEGPVERTGAQGPILSVYIRDPDGNLLEISQYLRT